MILILNEFILDDFSTLKFLTLSITQNFILQKKLQKLRPNGKL